MKRVEKSKLIKTFLRYIILLNIILCMIDNNFGERMGGTKLSDLEGLKKKEMDYLMDYTMSGVGTR